MAKNSNGKFIKFYSKKFLDKSIKKFLKSKKLFKRINIHENNKDRMHIMLMFYKKKFSYPAHYSINKSESFSAIKGKFKIIFYNKNKKTKSIILNKNENYTYKLNKNIFHKIIPLTKCCVALEILDGPYKKNSVKIINLQK